MCASQPNPCRGSTRRGHIKIVRVVVDVKIAWVEPGLPHLLGPALSATRRDYRCGGSRGVESVTVREAMFVAENGRLFIGAGLVPRVVAILRQHGHEVELRDGTHPGRRRWTRTDDAWLAKQDAETRAFVATLVENRRGQLVVSRLADKIRLIASMSRAFPKATISVVTATIQRARLLRYRLRPAVRTPVELFHGGSYRSSVRLRVCTIGSLEHRETDILVFDNATDAASKRGIELQHLLTNHRVYGFASAADDQGKLARLVIEGLVGPIVHEAPGPGVRRAGVRVLLAEVPPVELPLGLDALERKRRAVWHHEPRNVVIAQIARALAAGRPEDVWRHGLLLGYGEGLPAGRDGVLRVAVLVDSPEHGRALARHLPGWTVRSGRDGTGPTTPDRSILTLVRASAMKRLNVDVLVRADGGTGALDLPGFPPRVAGKEARTVLLIDLGDDGDARAAAATRSRLEAYEARGWQVGVPGRWTAGMTDAVVDGGHMAGRAGTRPTTATHRQVNESGPGGVDIVSTPAAADRRTGPTRRRRGPQRGLGRTTTDVSTSPTASSTEMADHRAESPARASGRSRPE